MVYVDFFVPKSQTILCSFSFSLSFFLSFVISLFISFSLALFLLFFSFFCYVLFCSFLFLLSFRLSVCLCFFCGYGKTSQERPTNEQPLTLFLEPNAGRFDHGFTFLRCSRPSRKKVCFGLCFSIHTPPMLLQKVSIFHGDPE